MGPAPKDLSAGGSIADAAGGLPRPARPARAWYDDPRVTIAFQYTVREDDKFPTGLVCTDLDHRPPGAEGMDRVGRRPHTDRPAPAIHLRTTT